MSTPLGNKQLGKLVANLQTRAGLYTEEKIPFNLIRDIMNEVVDELNGIAGTLDKEFYRESHRIPQASSVIMNYDTAASYTASTRTLIIPAAETDGTVTWSNETAFSAIFVGASVTWKSQMKGVEYNSVIESVTNGTTVVLSNATGYVLPAGNVAGSDIVDMIIPLNVSTADNLNIGALPIFKYIDYISSVEDSVTAEVLKINSEKEFNMISREGIYSAFSNSIIWTQVGDTLKFKKGSSVTSYGVRTMNIVRTPIAMSAKADYIDVRPANIGQVNDISLYRVLRAKKVTNIPQEVAMAETNLQKQKLAKQEEKKLEEAE